MRPRLRATHDRITFLESRYRSLIVALEYLENKNDELNRRVKFLEEHAQLAQFKREDLS